MVRSKDWSSNGVLHGRDARWTAQGSVQKNTQRRPQRGSSEDVVDPFVPFESARIQGSSCFPRCSFPELQRPPLPLNLQRDLTRPRLPKSLKTLTVKQTPISERRTRGSARESTPCRVSGRKTKVLQEPGGILHRKSLPETAPHQPGIAEDPKREIRYLPKFLLQALPSSTTAATTVMLKTCRMPEGYVTFRASRLCHTSRETKVKRSGVLPVAFVSVEEPKLGSAYELSYCYQRWRQRNRIADSKRVFIVCPVVEEILGPILVQRGWVQNRSMDSGYFDLRWTASRPAWHTSSPLLPEQIVNHFRSTHCFTRKDTLWETLSTEAHFSSSVNIKEFLPETIVYSNFDDRHRWTRKVLMGRAVAICKLFILQRWLLYKYKTHNKEEHILVPCLSSLTTELQQQVGARDVNVILGCLQEELRPRCVEAAVSMVIEMLCVNNSFTEKHVLSDPIEDDLKRILEGVDLNKLASVIGEKGRKLFSSDIVQVALELLQTAFWENRLSENLQSLWDDVENPFQFLATSTPSDVSKLEERISLFTKKLLGELGAHVFSKACVTTSAGVPMSCLTEIVCLTLLLVHKRAPSTFHIDGLTNAWIIKPATLSRGRNIELHRTLEGISCVFQTPAKFATQNVFICQKYIELPFIIAERKFDIRQWVLVTSWHPLQVWFYKDAYCRFAVEPFELEKLSDRFQHLTNNAVSKLSKRYEQTGIPGNMWSSWQLAGWLRRIASTSEKFRTRFGTCPWAESIQPKMQAIVSAVFRAAQRDMMTQVQRGAVHELFGFDFLLDYNLNVWLLEVNSCPDLTRSTPTTSALVTECLEDVLRVILDWQGAPKQDRSTINTGKFFLLPERESEGSHADSTRMFNLVQSRDALTIRGLRIETPSRLARLGDTDSPVAAFDIKKRLKSNRCRRKLPLVPLSFPIAVHRDYERGW